MFNSKTALVLGLLVAFAGCAMTGFINTVDLSLNPECGASARLFEEWDLIAGRWGLHKDEMESIPGKKVGYFGRPYHYYFLEVQETDGKVTTAKFVHEGRLASSSEDYIGPEKEFLEYVKNSLGPDILTVEHFFTHEQETE
ncbi:MAG: hypothetical protein JEZ02_18620 [Desulfatibacillum sp.]|nr:hypothetical protein [Desulfatibacillum sp.]